MLSRTPRAIAEHEARGDTARIYHEIRQTLRVTGVNLNFRTWAGFPAFFPPMWAAMQPIAASQAFEAASDGLRARAADLCVALTPLHVSAPLGESQRYQLERALALYHYINPKLLLFTVLVRRALGREPWPQGGSSASELAPSVPFGPPSNMAAMEMVEERSADPRVRRVFRDIKKTLGLSSINSDYRTLGLWPDYLEPAWAALKRTIQTPAYQEAAAALGRDAARAADRFATPKVDHRPLTAREDRVAVTEVTDRFERLLPALILNIALFGRDWWPGDRLRASPFPLPARRVGAGEERS